MGRKHIKPEIIRPAPSKRHPDLRNFAIYLFLTAATLTVYSRVRGFDFVSYDDRQYVTENPHVRAGLTLQGVTWALTTDRGGNWFPLTWLSHMLDWQLYGADSGRHHWTSVWIHTLSTLLLFGLLQRMTGSRWRSAVVAALFAFHPLHVESVAWVAERKDVLCALFWMLTLWGYAFYAERPRIGRYWLVLTPFCLGLLAKPMIITLPLVLLLLDFWPLRRVSLGPGPDVGLTQRKSPLSPPRVPVRRALLEKAPLLALSALMSVVTIMVQRSAGAVMSLEWLPLGTRLGNALISYVVYAAKLIWPTHLAVFYPQPIRVPAWQVVGAAAFVTGVTFLVLRSARRRPYLAVGWLWYLGTLLPVIGLIQVGTQARADRYTYLPAIGIFLMLAWGLEGVLAHRSWTKPVRKALPVVACSACLILTWFQIQVWKNSGSLFRHAIEVTADNPVAHNGLGIALQEQGQIQEAISHYQEAIRLKPGFADPYANLGDACLQLGQIDEAILQLTQALQRKPEFAEARINLGIALDRSGKPDEAIAQLFEAVQRKPDSVDAHYNLGRVYARMGNSGEAIVQFEQAIQLRPDDAEAHYNLGNIRAEQDDMNRAIAEFTTAIRFNPGYANAHNNLGSALAHLGRIDEAIAEFHAALRIKPDFPGAQRNLEYALSLRKKTPNR
jgi:tetratricopeptide (TPR) repeat protein